MYRNLVSEMQEKSVALQRIAEALNIHRNTARIKLIGNGEFTITQARTIRDNFFPDKNIDYLFARDPTKETA